MSSGEPLYFGPEERPLFGWLHRAARPARLGLWSHPVLIGTLAAHLDDLRRARG